MKRKIFSLLFIAISTIAFTSMAQGNDITPEDSIKKTCTCKKHNKGFLNKKHFNPFEGIVLSESQKEQLKEITFCHKKEKKQCSQETNDNKKSFREIELEKLNKIKSILTTEQYITYLENIALNKPHKHFKHTHRKFHHHNNHKPQQNN